MGIFDRIKQNVYAGKVLDLKGNWVSIDDAVELQHEYLDHLERGQVLMFDTWVSLDQVDDRIMQLKERVGPPAPQAGSVDESKKQIAGLADIPDPPRAKLPDASSSGTEQIVEPAEFVVDTSPQTRKLSALGNIYTLSDQSAVVLSQPDPQQNICHMKLSGKLNQATVIRFRDIQGKLEKFGFYHIILDLTNCEYIDSTGWGAISSFAKYCNSADGLLFVCCMSQEVADVYAMLQFNQILPAFDTFEQGIEALRAAISRRNLSRPDVRKKDTRTMDSLKSHDHILADSIKLIIAEYGAVSLGRLSHLLSMKEYGAQKVGRINLYLILRQLNLETGKKQERYFRSC
ncbi:MAG: STAS domain-containing protein [Chitinivibrionales bacterium]|nr:STAS domain-containing protein [Chitinivibrionales bacterium]